MNQCNKLLLGLIRNTSKQKIHQAFSQLAKKQYHVTPMHNTFPSRFLQNPCKFRQAFTAYDFLGKRGYADVGFPRGNGNGVSNGGGSKKEKSIINIVPNRGSNYGNFYGYGSRRCPDYSNLEGKIKDFLQRIKLAAEIFWLLLQNVAFITFGVGVALYFLMFIIVAYYPLLFEDPSQEELELIEAEKKAKARKKRSKSN